MNEMSVKYKLLNFENKVYFFSGEYCYVYDDKNDVVFENGTSLIKDRFPAIQNLTEVYPTEAYPFAVSEDIPSNIDAVVWSFIDGRLIFFKDQWVCVFHKDLIYS